MNPHLLILFRSSDRLDLASALMITAPLAELGQAAEHTSLFLDLGETCPRRPLSGLSESALDRLACLPIDSVYRVGQATAVPSISRLSATAALMITRERPTPSFESRAWFRELLLAAGLVAVRATHAVVEAGRPGDLLFARELLDRVDTALPGRCRFPVPLLSSFQPITALHGDGLMGRPSRDGAILVSDSPDVVARKVLAPHTSTRGRFEPDQELSPETRDLLLLLHVLGGESTSHMVGRLAGRSHLAIRREVIEVVNDYLFSLQRRRQRLLADEAGLRCAIQRTSQAIELEARDIVDTLTGLPQILAA